MPRSIARCTVAMPPIPRRSITSNGPYTSLLADPVKPVPARPGGWRALHISGHGTGQNRNLFRDGPLPAPGWARRPMPSDLSGLRAADPHAAPQIGLHLAGPASLAIFIQEAGACVRDRVAPGPVRIVRAI